MISTRKKEGRMTRKLISVTALLLSTALLCTTNSLAADGYDGTVTVGAGTVSLDNDSSKYGEYNGITEDEAFFVGDAEITYKSNGYHMDFTVEDVGHDDRNISIDSGRPGTYRLHLEYDESPHMISNTAKTPFRGDGSDNLTLPTLAQYTTSADIVAAFGLHDVELETKRRSGKIGYSRTLREGLDFSLSFKRERKNGTQSIGGVVMANSGKWASSSILPEPVDYTTDDLNVALEYGGTAYQASLAYNLSQFNNADESLTWQNPFARYVAPGPPATDPYATDGRLALPPDNRSQRLTFNGGAALTDTTRISLTAEYGITEQDEDLLPYATTATDPLPRESADAEMTSKHLGLNIASRPVRGLAVTAKYRYYETENDTPFDNYSIVFNDTVGKRAVETNKPYDYKQNRGNLDISYKVAKGTTLKLGFEHEIMERDERDVEETTEDTYSARVTSRISPAATLGLNYSASDREIDDDSALGDMRTFDVADRDRTKYGANVAFSMSQDATLGINYNQYSDDYDESVFGLQESDSRSYTLDASFAPTKRAALHAFYTREELDFSLANQYFTFSPGYTYLGDWYADHESVNDTAGLGASFELMGKRLSLNIDYIYARSTTAIDFTSTGGLTGDDMTDLETRRDTLEIDARYKMDKKLSLGLGYQYEKYEEDNWSRDGLSQTSIDYVLLMIGEEPDYDAHMIKLYATYRL